MRILCGHNIPFLLIHSLPGHDVTHASELGCHQLSNGRLLASAEESGFDVLITSDQDIRRQQNLTRQRLALVVLDTNHWPTIQRDIKAIDDALASAKPGAFVAVAFERRPLKRRKFDPEKQR